MYWVLLHSVVSLWKIQLGFFCPKGATPVMLWVTQEEDSETAFPQDQPSGREEAGWGNARGQAGSFG